MLGINDIKITPELLKQITEIDGFKGFWNGLDKHTTGLQLLGDFVDYGANFKRMSQALQNKPITPDIIRIIHGGQIKMKGPAAFRDDSDFQLEIKKDGDVVGALDVAEAEDIQPLLGKLCEWLNESTQSGLVHPLIKAAVFFAIFLQIAPFDKANLRTGQFLTLLILLKSGYTHIPYVSMGGIVNERAREVYEALEENQQSLEEGRPDWGPWLSCFLSLLQRQHTELHARLYDRKVDIQELPELSAKILEQFKTHKRLSMKDIIRFTNGRRATVKLRLNELIDGGYIHRHGQGRGTWYSLS